MEGAEDGIERVVDSKDMQQQTKAFDKLTDRVEDRQLDSSRVQEAMASIAASAEADWQAMRLREKELAAVKINAADVDIIANELEFCFFSFMHQIDQLELNEWLRWHTIGSSVLDPWIIYA
ncbi:hypothetical protein VIGAN_01513300 [Vigna angularis var. angularis]|uniref:Uncharacterized protein n=1 Tax=Vigna angularis var. angularis TaxID=157739 RepID=A0A0S3R8R0_PHAAN|nr:uncharacterized protein LOC108333390 isoform X1 [Vigna angularis]BAT77051.1 hypothetical protein VIGAN_01513300 [Vigna angularis var. angularis]